MNVQCCVTVSASNFQVLTRISGGARRALGNIIVRFLAGPALYAGDLFFFFSIETKFCEKIVVLLSVTGLAMVTALTTWNLLDFRDAEKE